MRFAALALAAAAVSGVLAQDQLILGFNSGASDDKGNPKSQQDFEAEFNAAKTLSGAPGSFNTIRLYSNIQWNTPDTPIAAFPAAIATNTKLLLGIWASGTDNIDNELKALNAAVKQYGTKLTDLIVGISVGSEDLYRVSETGIRNKAGVGNNADNIVKFIKTTRERLAATTLKNIKVTHVDTWTAWVNTSNKAVIDNVDFISVNAFPFYQQELDNTIEKAAGLLSDAITATEAVAGGKDVWVTETGWAYTGGNFGAAKSTNENARQYWKDVGCALFGKRNIFWYTLRDSNPANKVKFAILDWQTKKPRFDLTCPEQKTLPPGDSSHTGNSTTPGSNNNSDIPGAKNAGAVVSASLIHSVTAALAVVCAMAAWTL